jgi:hypothetical protein
MANLFFGISLAVARPLLYCFAGSGAGGQEMNLKHTTAFATLIFANSIFAGAASAQQPDLLHRLPVGTRIQLKLDAEINSEVSSVDDTFIAFVAKPVVTRDVVVLPVGTEIEGRVTRVSHAEAGAAGSIDVIFEKLKIGRRLQDIEGVLIDDVRPKPRRTSSLVSIFGGLAAGAILGGVAGRGNGALIGSGVGVTAGTGVALLRKGREARLKKDKEFEIELKREVLLPAIDY